MLGSIAQLAAVVEGRVAGDGEVTIARLSAIDDAGPDALTFATSEQYLAAAQRSKAAAILLEEALVPASSAKPLLIVKNTRFALAQLLRAFERPRPRGPFRHASAVVEDGAVLADNVYVGANAYVASGARVGSASVIGAGAHVGANTRIGNDCLLYPRATVLDDCEIGDRVILHPG
ncbi:MAG: UDP-3-O-(3-hydroxymyristoyl)glucosamine N-acyltransferase, partial [Candidatus Eremiobacteraeota bacterium]|nr:UDP-3-O-(3-hydroxymyristoyl)glucosamine N-acyltransferase [Candidatus Eremiobacteraeota bacterium]